MAREPVGERKDCAIPEVDGVIASTLTRIKRKKGP